MLLALGFGALSYISFDWVKSHLDALAVDGNADKFTPVVFKKMVSRLQIAGSGFLFLSFALILFRKPLQQHLHHSLTGISFSKFYRDTKHHISAAWTEVSPQHQFLFLIIFFIGVIIRICFLFQPMRHDEAFTFTNYASKPLFVALSNYSFPNNHLFHTFLVHIFYLCFGNHEWIIRLPALFTGILLLPVAYLTIRQFYTYQVALISLALIATASPLVEYSINARGYMLICLFFLLLLILAQNLLIQSDKARWITFSLVGALGLYTIPIMVYPLSIVFIWFFASILKTTNKRTRLRQLFFSGISIGLLTAFFYTPIFLGSGPQALFNNRFVRAAPSWESFFNALFHSGTELGQLWTLDYPFALTLLFIICLIIGCISFSNPKTVPLVIALPICLLLITLQKVMPPERTWLFLMPLCFAWIANGLIYFLEQLKPRSSHQTVITTIAGLLTIISLPGAIQNLSNHYQYGPGTLRDANQITQMLAPKLTPTDRVLTIATAAPLEYYFNHQNVSIKHLRTPITSANRIILIVMESKYSLEEVLKKGQIPSMQFSSPQLIHRYDSAAIYMLIRQSL
ncbi:MAG: hypothetical protein HOE48_01990 [Candidatus Latescibacteria bacterium]|nr:hypothetical protein [Candidatus Latescibacterota bacterium]MBT4136650.1 hypothetical protein [Candidatus Latescibacterota bacterium]